MCRQIIEPEVTSFYTFPVIFYLSVPVAVTGHEPSYLKC